MSRQPTFRDVIRNSLPDEFSDALSFLGLTRASFPSAGANGTVAQGVTIQKGTQGISTAIIVGDGTTSLFTITHSLGVQVLDVRLYLAGPGGFGSVVRPRWTWTPGSLTSAVDISFAHDYIPAVGQIIYAAVYG